ncbi:acyl-CoA dehydrogenase [Salinadaptatus halalkaliphilus]|uniref:Acyl-CoA dehydrogenase n=1 Tax=Salinadaptatus halalkaliphilus TaxID=2419781 RepID=A0A4S3TPM5_9EURY|nr:acyl-CoA dehydrogenase family protein [Salinadaptatus halalkaliphilus]THE66319.1 acyl-CoA dehydrogenase [Salinadaptatus halalkaliphilus]
MEFQLSQEQRLIRDEIRTLCSDFGDEYWREKNRNHEFAWEFFEAFADGGWCGITVPEAYGGQGYGVQEASIVQQEIARSGAAMAGTSITSHHVFSVAPLVEFGDEAHKERYLPQIADGDVMVCTGVTEPNAGTDTSRIETTADRQGDEYVINGQKIWTSKAQEADVIMLLARTKPREDADRFGGLSLFFTEFSPEKDGVDVQEIPKAGRGAADSNEVWFDDVRIPAEDRIGEEGEGFTYLLSFANSERISIAANAVGIGQAAIDKAADYARERQVFDDVIGSYQAIQHPLADSWSKLEQDELMVRKAAWCYDEGKDAGAPSNAVKLRASEDAIEACERAVRVHGGMGYAQEYDVERYWREAMINVIAPISNEMVKNYIAQHVLELPRSY